VRRTRNQAPNDDSRASGSHTSNRQSSIINRQSNRFLLDTIGELRMAYALADLVVVGRTFGELHGSDMMEPAALGKAVIVGPAVRDFQDSADALLAGDGLVQTSANDLPRVLAELLKDRSRRERLAANARRVIIANQGATERHAAWLREVLARP
jgi:3-deoxy-D-manno-octulosonic-acid transferase